MIIQDLTRILSTIHLHCGSSGLSGLSRLYFWVHWYYARECHPFSILYTHIIIAISLIDLHGSSSGLNTKSSGIYTVYTEHRCSNRSLNVSISPLKVYHCVSLACLMMSSRGSWRLKLNIRISHTVNILPTYDL